MTGHSTTRSLPDWLIRIAPTVLRCHLVGSLTATALIVCTAWVCSHNRIEVATVQYNGTDVDLREAWALAENADQWRMLYTVNYKKTLEVNRRVESIAKWLPRSVDWSKTQDDIQSIGESADISILTIERGEDHVGTRVGVVLARCEVQGSYASLCRFLSELSHRPQPIACNQIQLHRAVKDAIGKSGVARPGCRATLSLRIPFAASGTAAGRLLPAEIQHAS